MIEFSFDEASRRLPTFDPDSVPVPFGNTTLYIPRPRLMIRRRAGAAEWCHGFGSEFDALVDRVEAKSSGSTFVDLVGALFDLAAFLIQRNYRVEDAELDAMMVVDPAEFAGGALPEPWASVWAVALSIPKSSGDGPSPPASSPGSTPTD